MIVRNKCNMTTNIKTNNLKININNKYNLY